MRMWGRARRLGALAATTVVVGASMGGSAGAAAAETEPIGQALMTAAKASGVLEAIEGSLVYLGARYESATTAEGVPAQTAQSGEPSLRDYETGKVPLPPASAGSNGTTAPPPPGSHGEPFVARIPTEPNAYGDPPATYVSGIALAPPEAPERIAATINAANTIVGTPYRWGGGHGSWYDRGYDCSGAVSFALAGGGFLAEPLTSGQFESYGAPGPGRWITIYASGSHAYAVIAGLRWDTVGNARGSGPRWHVEGTPPAGFVARHPPGY